MKNKGFSLVEAIVAFAIAAIAGAAVFGMMSASSNSFRKTSNDVGLQYEQQIVVNKLIDTLVESTNALGYDETKKTLVVYNKVDEGPVAENAVLHKYSYYVNKIAFEKDSEDSETGKLAFYSKKFDDIASVKATDLDDADDEDVVRGLFGEDVKDIKFDISKIDSGKIIFDITFSSNGKEYKSTQVVALRNNVDNSDSAENIFASDGAFLNSFIKSIAIYRDDKYFTQGAVDEIALNGTVSVQYNAKVTPINEKLSEREYGVTWSLKNNVEGMSVGASTGLVTVDESVLTGDITEVTNVLVATSVDDPKKFQELNIKVVGGGDYPKSIELSYSENNTVPTVRKYNITPLITYLSGTTSTNVSLCNWEWDKDKLDQDSGNHLSGCSFDEKTGELVVTHAANGEKFKFTATTKAASKDGVRLKASIIISVEGIPEDIDKQQLGLAGKQDIYNSRGDYSTVNPTWINGITSAYDYHWTIAPYGDNWTEEVRTKDFSKMISIWRSDKNEYVTNCVGRTLTIYCDPELDWSGEYSVKVTCYATDKNGKKYGIGNEKENTYSGPVEYIMTFKPVKVILVAQTSFRDINKKEYVFNVDRNLKRASDGKATDNTYPASSKYEGNTVRSFRISARGVRVESSNPITVSLDKNLSNFYDNLVKFEKQDSDINHKAVLTAGAKNLFGECDYAESRGMGIGFYFKMNDESFNEAYFGQKSKPKFFAPKFMASSWTGENEVECYIAESENDYYYDTNLVKSSDYKYQFVYDSEKINDENYVETYTK